MRLISLQLCNFRQFYGKTPEIYFASGDRNTTVIHGNNGAGKTTLLNAFTWALYEKFTRAFAAEDQLVNKRALGEAKPGKAVECSVEMQFEHDSKRYHLKRLYRAYNTELGIERGESELYVQFVGDDGRWSFLPQEQPPEQTIGRILPESLHQYFFFDGERIDAIMRDEKKAEIAEATKELLGIKVLNRSIDHLKNARRTLEDELEAIGDPETKTLLQQKEDLEQARDRLVERQAEIQQELQNLDEIKKALASRFQELSEARGWQQKRTDLEAQIKGLRSQLIETKDNLRAAISTQGYLVLLPDAIAQFQNLVQKLRDSGQLSNGVQQQFIQELLDRQRCICGTELQDGTSTYEMVKSWLDKAGMADVEETTIRLRDRVEDMSGQAETVWQTIDGHKAKIEDYRRQLSSCEDQLDDIRSKLRSYPNEEIGQLQKRLDETDERQRELTLNQGANQQKIHSLTQEIDRLDKKIAKHQMKENKQKLAQRRIGATHDAIVRLTEVRSRLERQFRASLEQRVQEIFDRISFTPYRPKLNDKYELTLVEKTGGWEKLVAASTGENQILSLSFIGGIIDRVREWSRNKMLMGPDSSTFPVVMDSPFGSLDEIYRRQVAKAIPELANQLVVLATKTQWRGEVEREMKRRIGRQYVLSYKSPKPDCEEDAIELNGSRYPLVTRSPNEFEYTKIVEVETLF
jgi:DNA sulfur modification protein DndD